MITCMYAVHNQVHNLDENINATVSSNTCMSNMSLVAEGYKSILSLIQEQASHHIVNLALH